MRENVITLTKTNLERLTIVRRIQKRQLNQTVAAELLGLSTRQVRNLARKYEQEGAKGLAHRIR